MAIPIPRAREDLERRFVIYVLRGLIRDETRIATQALSRNADGAISRSGRRDCVEMLQEDLLEIAGRLEPVRRGAHCSRAGRAYNIGRDDNHELGLVALETLRPE